MPKDNKTLIREAKRKLAKIGKMFEGRDKSTHYQTLVYLEDGEVTAALKLWTGRRPFDTEVDTQLVEANLSLFGGFTDVTRSLSDGNKELTYYSTYTGGGSRIDPIRRSDPRGAREVRPGTQRRLPSWDEDEDFAWRL